MDLIPGLPNDVAIECLIRIPLQSLTASSKVSCGWKAEIERPEFCQRRKSIRSTQKFIVVGQSFVSDNIHLLAFCDSETGEWSDLPPIPDLTIEPYFPCQLVRVGSKLVAFGSRNSVFIFNFLKGIWRRGTPMPDDERIAFTCASDYDQTVYVAGGWNTVTDILSSSALAYNVAKDEWKKLPNMNIGRCQCTATFKDGMLHVIGGLLGTNVYELCASKETFDVAMWRWNPVEEDFLEKPTWWPTICVSSPNDGMYMCEDGKVSIREGATWRVVVELPHELRHIRLATASQGKLFVIGSDYTLVSPRVHVMDLKSYTWTSIEAPDDYLAHADSLCFLEI